MKRSTRLSRWGIALVLLVAACEQANPVEDEPVPVPSLDEQLVDAITFSGQRGLSNFILPESDDFAAIPQDPSNPLTEAKVELGRLLFHETALATNPVRSEGFGTYACATCHHAGAGFQAARAQAIGEGGMGWGSNASGRRPDPAYAIDELDVQPIRTPSVLNAAYQEVMGWAGKFGAHGPNRGTEDRWIDGTPMAVNRMGYDGLESQAIAGLTVHRMSRLDTSIVVSHPEYVQRWEAAFPGQAPSLESAGLAIAAYERTLLANRAPFQRWLRGETAAMTDAEKRGALVFFGKAKCEVCHTGPAFNQVAFYALGMPDLEGIRTPDPIASRGRGGFLNDPDQDFKFKVPQLYNLIDSPFYGHGGTFRSVREVVEYYNEGIPAVNLPPGRLASRFEPLNLSPREVDDLVAFLTGALHDPDLDRYIPDRLPSGQCTPANDPQARADLGC